MLKTIALLGCLVFVASGSHHELGKDRSAQKHDRTLIIQNQGKIVNNGGREGDNQKDTQRSNGRVDQSKILERLGYTHSIDELGTDRETLLKQKFLLDVLLNVNGKLLDEELIQLGLKLNADDIGPLDADVTDFLQQCIDNRALSKEQEFDILNPTHLRQLTVLSKFLVQAKDWESFQRIVCFARLRLNGKLLTNALLLAIKERPDSSELVMPAVQEILPELFFESEILEKAHNFDVNELATETANAGRLTAQQQGLIRPLVQQWGVPIKKTWQEWKAEKLKKQDLYTPKGIDADKEDKIILTSSTRISEQGKSQTLEERISYLAKDLGLNDFMYNLALNNMRLMKVSGNEIQLQSRNLDIGNDMKSTLRTTDENNERLLHINQEQLDFKDIVEPIEIENEKRNQKQTSSNEELGTSQSLKQQSSQGLGKEIGENQQNIAGRPSDYLTQTYGTDRLLHLGRRRMYFTTGDQTADNDMQGRRKNLNEGLLDSRRQHQSFDRSQDITKLDAIDRQFKDSTLRSESGKNDLYGQSDSLEESDRLLGPSRRFKVMHSYDLAPTRKSQTSLDEMINNEDQILHQSDDLRYDSAGQRNSETVLNENNSRLLWVNRRRLQQFQDSSRDGLNKNDVGAETIESNGSNVVRESDLRRLEKEEVDENFQEPRRTFNLMHTLSSQRQNELSDRSIERLENKPNLLTNQGNAESISISSRNDRLLGPRRNFKRIQIFEGPYESRREDIDSTSIFNRNDPTINFQTADNNVKQSQPAEPESINSIDTQRRLLSSEEDDDTKDSNIQSFNAYNRRLNLEQTSYDQNDKRIADIEYQQRIDDSQTFEDHENGLKTVDISNPRLLSIGRRSRAQIFEENEIIHGDLQRKRELFDYSKFNGESSQEQSSRFTTDLLKSRAGERYLLNIRELLARINLERLSNLLQDKLPLVDKDLSSKRLKSSRSKQKETAIVQSILTKYTDVVNELYTQSQENQQIANIKHILKGLIKKDMQQAQSQQLQSSELLNIIGSLLFTRLSESELQAFENMLELSSPDFLTLNLGQQLNEPLVLSTMQAIIELVDEYKQSFNSVGTQILPRFTDIRINSIKVDQLQTFCESVDSDLLNALPIEEKLQSPAKIANLGRSVVARQLRLNHKEFSIKLELLSDKTQKVLIQILLGPKTDAANISKNIKNFYLLDAFPITLDAGRSNIKRKSKDINWTGRDTTTYTQLYKNVMQAINGELSLQLSNIANTNCRFPHNLLLPRGLPQGLPVQLLVVVTPQLNDGSSMVRSNLNEQICGMGMAALSSEGLDLERELQGVNIENLQNVMLQDVLIYHFDQLNE